MNEKEKFKGQNYWDGTTRVNERKETYVISFFVPPKWHLERRDINVN